LLKKKGERRKMKKIAFVVMAVLMTVLLFSPVMSYPPRHCKGLDVYFYASDSTAFAALLAGEIDFMQWSLTYEQYLDACATPDLQLAGYSENGMMEFDINNNYTIAQNPGIRNPCNELSFRQALAMATDKDYIVNEIIKGFAERIDCPICAPQASYGNETCCGPEPNYPYPYDTDAANALLDANGFDDWDGDNVRNYPLDWDGVEGVIGVRDEPNLCDIDLCIRMMHAHRNAAGTRLGETMRDVLHLPVNFHYGTSDDLYPIVMGARDYHIYTGGWNLGRYPTYLFGLFHESNWYPDGSNYVTGMNKSNLPNYPDLDEDLYDVYYAPSMADFVTAVKKASGKLVCDYCVNIPLWSYKSWWAYSKNLVGIVNMDGYGLENSYTFLNAYKVDDAATPGDESQDPIRMGTVHAPKDLNMLYSTWYYDYAVLDRFSASLLSVNPYALSIDQPWLAQDWEVTTWYDPQDDETKTKVTYWIRKDVWWHAPVTGEAVQQFTAHDVEFSIWYIYPHTDAWNWPMARDVHHTHLIDNFTIEVYFDSASIFHVYAPTGPLLKKHALQPLLCKEECYPFEVTEPRVPSDKDILPGGSIVQIINATKYPEDIPLVEGVDYEVFGTGAPDYCHNEIHWLRPLEPGETVVFCYWTPDLDPHGYYLANLPWEQTFYSLGPYYVTAMSEGVGGYAIMDCNPTFFLETPPLGEIDWMWYWSGTTKPRSGYYQINLYDAVTLLKAYGTRGDTCPVPPNWMPGADIDANDLCHVGLYDAVGLLKVYGTKFGIPPDP
jgi:ABC-type transport system substrate-binding protein